MDVLLMSISGNQYSICTLPGIIKGPKLLDDYPVSPALPANGVFQRKTFLARKTVRKGLPLQVWRENLAEMLAFARKVSPVFYRIQPAQASYDSPDNCRL
jgi:hypothetical protein